LCANVSISLLADSSSISSSATRGSI
jgi:hypothetical protein